MQFPKIAALMLLLWLGQTQASQPETTLHGPIRIHSDTLGYDLQYWIYLPAGSTQGLPELYVTDGQAYLSAGHMVETLDREIAAGAIARVAVIFVDSRDPDDPSRDRRNEQFMCNQDYGTFFIRELMPEISSRWTGADATTRRGLAGVSFGAINAACFGVMMPGVFQVLILQSPASDAHVDVVRGLYEEKPRSPSAIFISHGGRLDNGTAARRFAEALERKGYPVRHLANNGRHDWDNWAPLIDDALRAFVGLAQGDRIDEAQ